MSLFYSGTEDNAANYADQFGIDESEIEADAWTGFGTGLGMGAVKGTFAETGRTVAMAGSVVPIAYDLMSGDKGQGAQDWYFKNVIDDTFNNAVDYWTPKESEVGTAGQIAGGIAGGLGQLALGLGNPSPMIATAQMGTGIELVRNGVDATTAQDIGAIAGLSMAVGAWLPVFGTSTIAKVLGNAAVNPLIGMAQRGASGAILENAGYAELAEGYNAWDATAIAIDAAMGGAFGYVGRNYKAPDITEAMIGKTMSEALTKNSDEIVRSFLGTNKIKLSPKEMDDLSALGNKKSLIYDSAPGKPLNDEALNAHTSTINDSVDALLTGKPIDVAKRFDGSEQFETARPDVEYSSAFKAAAAELGVQLESAEAMPVVESAPIQPIDIKKPAVEVVAKKAKQPTGIEADYQVAEALRLSDNKELKIESDSGKIVSAKKELSSAIADHKIAQELESGFKAAALCVLGG